MKAAFKFKDLALHDLRSCGKAGCQDPHQKEDREEHPDAYNKITGNQFHFFARIKRLSDLFFFFFLFSKHKSHPPLLEFQVVVFDKHVDKSEYDKHDQRHQDTYRSAHAGITGCTSCCAEHSVVHVHNRSDRCVVGRHR